MAKPKGSLNRNQIFLMNRLKTMLGDDFDPVVNMAKNAVEIQKQGDKAVEAYHKLTEPTKEDLSDLFIILANCIEAWNKIAAYTNAKIRTIEFTSDLGIVGVSLITDGMTAKEAADHYQQEVLSLE